MAVCMCMCLYYTDPPTITAAPTAERVVKGRDATLRCHADANPPVTYEWFRASIDSRLVSR